MTTYSDSFNRADNVTLSAGWTDRRGSMGIESNEALPQKNTYCTSTFDSTLSFNDMEVTITLGALIGVPAGAWVVLGANTSGESVIAGWDESSNFNIYSMTGWTEADRTLQNTATVSLVTGDTLGLRRMGNVYTGNKNGVAVSGSSWIDSGNLVPRDSNHRIAGFGTWGSTSLLDYRRVDAWTVMDFTLVTPKPELVRQAVKRSYVY